MKKYIFILLMLFVLGGGGYYAVDKLTKQETVYDDNEILDAVLSTSAYRLPTQYSVVRPMSCIPDFESMEAEKKYVKPRFNFKNPEIDELIDFFFVKNQQSVKLSLKSNPQQHYIVDYDDKLHSQLESDISNFPNLIEDYPNVSKFVRISQPALSDSGYVFLYMETSYWGSGGEGSYVLYQFIDGKLHEIKRLQVWMA